MKLDVELWWRGPARESFSLCVRYGEDREVLLVVPAEHLDLLVEGARKLRASKPGTLKADPQAVELKLEATEKLAADLRAEVDRLTAALDEARAAYPAEPATFPGPRASKEVGS